MEAIEKSRVLPPSHRHFGGREAQAQGPGRRTFAPSHPPVGGIPKPFMDDNPILAMLHARLPNGNRVGADVHREKDFVTLFVEEDVAGKTVEVTLSVQVGEALLEVLGKVFQLTEPRVNNPSWNQS